MPVCAKASHHLPGSILGLKPSNSQGEPLCQAAKFAEATDKLAADTQWSYRLIVDAPVDWVSAETSLPAGCVNPLIGPTGALSEFIEPCTRTPPCNQLQRIGWHCAGAASHDRAVLPLGRHHHADAVECDRPPRHLLGIGLKSRQARCARARL